MKQDQEAEEPSSGAGIDEASVKKKKKKKNIIKPMCLVNNQQYRIFERGNTCGHPQGLE